MRRIHEGSLDKSSRWPWFILTIICVFIIFSAYNGQYLSRNTTEDVNTRVIFPDTNSALSSEDFNNTSVSDIETSSSDVHSGKSFLGHAHHVLSKDNYLGDSSNHPLEAASGKDVTTSAPKKHNVLFIKTHKCGTSTIVNMLYLYGIRRKLNFALQPYKHRINISKKMNPLVPPRPGGEWNIQCQHGTFNPAVEHQILPKETTLYTTIIRSPVSHFQSAFSFWGNDKAMTKKYGKIPYEESINKWLDQQRSPTETSAPLSLTLNSAAKDLGWNIFPRESNLQLKIDKFIDMLANEMDLVLLTDRMDESLVMMKIKLNWDMTDILYLKRMVARNNRKTSISDGTIKRIMNFQIIDRQIFGHFNKTFEQEIDKFGRDQFYFLVSEFKTLRESFENKCFDKNKTVHGPYGSISWALSKKYGHENKACEFLQMRDVKITDIVTQLQLSEDYKHSINGKSFIEKQIIEKIQSDYQNYL